MLRTYKLLSQVGRPFSTKARSQLTESVDILYKASRERLSAEKDPLILGKYHENHSAYLLSQAEEVQQSHFSKNQFERPQEQMQTIATINSGAEVFGKTVTLEDISGLSNGRQTKRRNSVHGLDLERFRHFDGRDYEVAEHIDTYGQVLGLDYVKLVLGEHNQLFDNILQRGDHFEKFLAQKSIKDPLPELKPNQILIFGIPGSFPLQTIVSLLKERDINVNQISSKRSPQGELLYHLLTLNESGVTVDRLKAAASPNRIMRRAQFVTHEVERSPLENRVVVITNISKHQRMEDIYQKVNQVAKVGAFEYAVEYTNPDHPSTEEVLKALQSKDFVAQLFPDRIAKSVEIHEVHADSVTVLHFDASAFLEGALKPQAAPVTSTLGASSFEGLQALSSATAVDASSGHKAKIPPIMIKTRKFKTPTVATAASVTSSNHDGSSHLRRDYIPNSLRQVPESSVGELELRGEHHLGYCFLTFLSETDAKKVLLWARNGFQLFSVPDYSQTPMVDLLNDNFHLNFDKKFETEYLRSLEIYSQSLESEKAVLKHSMEMAQYTLKERERLMEALGDSVQKNADAISKAVDPEEADEEGLTGAEIKANHQRRLDRLNLRTKINQLLMMEANDKFISNTNSVATIQDFHPGYVEGASGRNFGKLPAESFQRGVLFKLLNRGSREGFTSYSGARSSPAVTELMESILNEYTEEAVATEVAVLMEDFATNRQAATFLVKGYSHLHAMETRQQPGPLPSIYEELGIQTKQPRDYPMNIDQFLETVEETKRWGGDYTTQALGKTKAKRLEKAKKLAELAATKKEGEEEVPTEPETKPKRKVWKGMAKGGFRRLLPHKPKPAGEGAEQKRNFSVVHSASGLGTRAIDFEIYQQRLLKHKNRLRQMLQGDFSNLELDKKILRYTTMAEEERFGLREVSHVYTKSGQPFVRDRDIEETKNEIISKLASDAFPADFLRNLLINREDEEDFLNRDGGVSIREKSLKTLEEREYEKYVGKVVGVLQVERNSQTSVDQICQELNTKAVLVEYRPFKISDNNTVILKVLVSQRKINYQRLRNTIDKHLKSLVVKNMADKPSTTVSIGLLEARFDSLNIAQKMRQVQLVLLNPKYTEEAANLLVDKISPSEVELILNLQPADEHQILVDAESQQLTAKVVKDHKPPNPEVKIKMASLEPAYLNAFGSNFIREKGSNTPTVVIY